MMVSPENRHIADTVAPRVVPPMVAIEPSAWYGERLLSTKAARGFTLVEMLVTLVISAFVLVSLNGLLSGVFEARDVARGKNALSRDLRFAMDRG